jgi:hypothetical protein
MIVDLSEPRKSRYELTREREKGITEMRRVVSFWNRGEIKDYINNRNKNYRLTDAGMAAILQRFIYNHEFQIGDMSEDLKNGFDIVRTISKNSKIYFKTTDLIYEFINTYKDVIASYDRSSAQTYHHKLLQDYDKSVRMVNRKLEIEEELRAVY